jgi:predicted metal-dependent hydrolase
MSRRSRQSAPTITLFSFQDIIMSTSGIMIMIVLILCLELIESQEISASPAITPAVSLEDTISQLQREINELERKNAEINSLIQSAAQMTASELDEQIENLQTVNRLLNLDLEGLQAKWREIEDHQSDRKMRRDELAELQQQIIAGQRDVDRMTQELEIEARENRPIFSLPRGENRDGWIVDISASLIQVAPIGRAERPVVFTSDGKSRFFARSPQQAFLEWSKQKGTDTYFFLFVRPDGVDAFQEVTEVFNKRDVSYGFDLADSGQVLLHPIRGAAE